MKKRFANLSEEKRPGDKSESPDKSKEKNKK